MRCCLTLGSLLFLVLAPGLRAQSFDTSRPFWEITAQAGFFAPEEPEEAEIDGGPLFGARVGYRRAAGFSVEVHGAYTPLELQAEGNPPEVVDLPALLYGVDVVYTWPIAPRADFFISTGIGGITWSPDAEGGGEEIDSETNLRLPLGAGIHYMFASGIAVRADVRDHIIFDQLSETARALALVDRGNTNNLEGSIGLSLILP